jgi:hypothetical protein
MTFIFGSKRYVGTTAVQIIRAMMKDSDFTVQNSNIKDYLRSSLDLLTDRVHPRELELSAHLSDEILAYNYLCLLDEYKLGCLYQTRARSETSSR